MAYELVDSTQLDADLTSVANAIRTKGETSESLSFPSDFISAINAIDTGGGGGGGDLPDNMSIEDYTVSTTSALHTITHSLWKIPDMFLIIPAEKPTGNGANAPFNIMGVNLTGSGVQDYPNKLISSCKKSNGDWDYSLGSQGWTGTTTSISLSFSTAARMPTGTYKIVFFAFNTNS